MQYDIIITGNCVHFWKFDSNVTAVNKPADEVPRSQPLIVHLLIVFYGSICPDDYRTRLPLEYPSSACDFCLSHFPFTKKWNKGREKMQTYGDDAIFTRRT